MGKVGCELEEVVLVEWRGRSGLAGDADDITLDDAIPAGFIGGYSY